MKPNTGPFLPSVKRLRKPSQYMRRAPASPRKMPPKKWTSHSSSKQATASSYMHLSMK